MKFGGKNIPKEHFIYPTTPPNGFDEKLESQRRQIRHWWSSLAPYLSNSCPHPPNCLVAGDRLPETALVYGGRFSDI